MVTKSKLSFNTNEVFRDQLLLIVISTTAAVLTQKMIGGETLSWRLIFSTILIACIATFIIVFSVFIAWGGWKILDHYFLNPVADKIVIPLWNFFCHHNKYSRSNIIYSTNFYIWKK